MENASKALIIAGSVLISMLVIAALIFTFSQVRNLRSQEQTAEETDEIAEYNNKFNKYASDSLYGVDLISLCNEVSNYNKKESDNKYYHEIKLTFEMKTKTSLEPYIHANKTYYYIKDNNPNNDTNLYNQYKLFENHFEEVSNREYYDKNNNNYKYKIKQLATMRKDELKNKVGEPHPGNMDDDIAEYNNLKTSFTEFKTKRFKGEITKQDSTGRITEMKFTSKD